MPEHSFPSAPHRLSHSGVVTPTHARVHIVCGNGNRELGQRIAMEIGAKLTDCRVGRRACGEVAIEVDPIVRGGDVYVVQPTCASATVDVNTSVLELLFLVRRLKLAGAARVTALIPFFAYARQDRKCDLRSPISAAAVARMIDTMGVDRVVTLDLHSGQIQGYFNGRAPLDNLQMAHEFAQYVRTCRWFDPTSTCVVSPDAGGVARAHSFADLLGVSHVVTVMKRRARAGVVADMQTVGDVKGYTCLIIDDMVDTGGTLVAACRLLKGMGATRVVACITHGIMTDPCCTRVNECDALDELVVSDSLPQNENKIKSPKKLQVLGIAAMLAQAVDCYHRDQSISLLFGRPSTPAPRIAAPPRNLGMSPISMKDSPFPPSSVATPSGDQIMQQQATASKNLLGMSIASSSPAGGVRPASGSVMATTIGGGRPADSPPPPLPPQAKH